MADLGQSGGDRPLNPLRPVEELKEPSSVNGVDSVVHPQRDQQIGDSAVTKAEKYERHGPSDDPEDSPVKRRRLDGSVENREQGLTKSERIKGVAPIKAESADLRALKQLRLT